MPMPVRSASAAGKRSARAPGREPGLIMSILIGAILLVTLSGCQTANAAAACTPGDPMRAGHYYLNGLMEVGSELLLNNDGSFEFMLAYGALDQYGKGCWRVEGNKLLVIPEGRSAPAAQYSIDDSSLSALRSPSKAANSSGTSAAAHAVATPGASAGAPR